ncbi:unnamed protein product [Cuscuta epithymum]|uniref:Fe2OG dioxygenase domain-containing protein n=1 Tax=Cuscuta epithymum TaxID=186058 RepID=A0AAV0D3H9_9ASTE|nr:unnamed protein product [Cuscuta epithymum]
MAEQSKTRSDDPFLLKYTANELRTVSEFVTNWAPFLSRGLCHSCCVTISDRIRYLHQEAGRDVVCAEHKEDVAESTSGNKGLIGDWNQENCDTHSIGSWNNASDMNDHADTHSLGSWKGEEEGSPEAFSQAGIYTDVPSKSSGAGMLKSENLSTHVLQGVKMSWADMAQEDELETEECGLSLTLTNESGLSWKEGAFEHDESHKPKTELSREQRECIRFSNVKRKKDFICLERIDGKITNILDGLELHSGIFSAAEQNRIVNYVETLHDKGKNGQLKERTYTAPEKCIGGKGRVSLQFGCCYNYASDTNDTPRILKNDIVDPIPQLLKVMIKRLVRWHVIPPNSVPDNCIVDIYEEGDCIPPRIESQDFARPLCAVSFLTECHVIFGSNLKVLSPGGFDGPIAISLPVGSILVLNGKVADVAKHCVPAVPSKRISITFRRTAESKQPVGYVPDPDLQGLQPLSNEVDKSKKSKKARHRQHDMKKHVSGREENVGGQPRRPIERGFGENRYSLGQSDQRNTSKPRVTVDLERSADQSYRRTVRFHRHLP